MSVSRPVVLGIVLALLAAFGFQHFVLAPKQAERADLDARIAAQHKRLDTARRQLAANRAARAGYGRDYATVLRLGKAVPSDDDTRTLLYQLSLAAKGADVHFDAIDVDADGGAASSAATGSDASAAGTLPPGATVGPAGLPVVPFKFTFSGGYFDLGNFMHRLRAFVKAGNRRVSVTGRLVTIDSVKLTPDDEHGGFPRILAEVGATTFVLPEQEGATNGATADAPPTEPVATTPATAAGGTVPTTGSTR